MHQVHCRTGLFTLHFHLHRRWMRAFCSIWALIQPESQVMLARGSSQASGSEAKLSGDTARQSPMMGRRVVQSSDAAMGSRKNASLYSTTARCPLHRRKDRSRLGQMTDVRVGFSQWLELYFGPVQALPMRSPQETRRLPTGRGPSLPWS